MSTVDLTAHYRRNTLTLRAQTLRDFTTLWPILSIRRLDATYPAWASAVYTLVTRDRGRASGLASVYLALVRSASGAAGTAPTVLPKPLDVEQFAASLRSTSVIAVKRSLMAGKTELAAMETAFTQASGAATRHVLNAGREVIIDSAVADPSARGWTRVASGSACDFCAGLADGAVLSDAVEMATHDHCSCSPEPVYS